MNYTQTHSSACQTTYEVEFGDKTYHLRLWVIVGGIPALGFKDRLGPTRRYPRVPSFDRGSLTLGEFDTLSGPTFENVLPNNAVEEYLEWAVPQHEEARRKQAEEKRAQAIVAKVGLPRYKWFERVPEETPRHVPNSLARPDGLFIAEGRDIVAALKRAQGQNKGAVRIGEVIVGVTGLRKYARTVARDTLLIEVQRNHIVVVHSEGRGCSTIVHGAWDRYHGLNGHTCELTFGRTR